MTSTGDGRTLATTVCVSSINCVTVIFSVAPETTPGSVVVAKQMVIVVGNTATVVITVPQLELVELAGASRCNFRIFLKGGPVSVIVMVFVLVRTVVVLMVVFGDEIVWMTVVAQTPVITTV